MHGKRFCKTLNENEWHTMSYRRDSGDDSAIYIEEPDEVIKHISHVVTVKVKLDESGRVLEGTTNQDGTKIYGLKLSAKG
jgi:hypothetical protein